MNVGDIMGLKSRIKKSVGDFFEFNEQTKILKNKIEETEGLLVDAKKELGDQNKLSRRLSVARGLTSSPEVGGKEFTSRSRARIADVTLRAMYKQTSSVRACVSKIILDIVTMPWMIIPKTPDATEFDSEEILRVTSFFNDPNINHESFSQISAKLLKDILVLGRGTLEKVKAVTGDTVLEIFNRDAQTIIPKKDIHGVLLGYEQRVTTVVLPKGGNKAVQFTPDEIMFMSLPSDEETNSIYPTPILEGIVNEVGALLFAIDFIAKSFDEDEIPPGILSLKKLGEESYERAKEEFTTYKGRKGKQKIHVFRNVEGMEWIELTRANKEQQTVELMSKLESIVYRGYGLTSPGMGASTGSRGADQAQIQLGKSDLIVPLINVLMYFINKDLMPSLGAENSKFVIISKRLGDELKLSRAAGMRVRSGLRTLNEERQADGLLPYTGPAGNIADKPFVTIGNSVHFLEDLQRVANESGNVDDRKSLSTIMI